MCRVHVVIKNADRNEWQHVDCRRMLGTREEKVAMAAREMNDAAAGPLFMPVNEEYVVHVLQELDERPHDDPSAAFLSGGSRRDERFRRIVSEVASWLALVVERAGQRLVVYTTSRFCQVLATTQVTPDGRHSPAEHKSHRAVFRFRAHGFRTHCLDPECADERKRLGVHWFPYEAGEARQLGLVDEQAVAEWALAQVRARGNPGASIDVLDAQTAGEVYVSFHGARHAPTHRHGDEDAANSISVVISLERRIAEWYCGPHCQRKSCQEPPAYILQ